MGAKAKAFKAYVNSPGVKAIHSSALRQATGRKPSRRMAHKAHVARTKGRGIRPGFHAKAFGYSHSDGS